MTGPVRIYVQPVAPGRFNARLGSPDGELLVSSSREPALASARVLIGRGYAPGSIIEMWDAERPFPRLRGVLDVMAAKTVVETENGPRFRQASGSLLDASRKGETPLPATSVAPEAPASARKACDSSPDLSGEALP